MLRRIAALMAAMGLGMIGFVALDLEAGSSLDGVIRSELRAGLPPQEAERIIAAALDQGDVETAFAYGETARYADIPLSEPTEARLVEAGSFVARLSRGATQFSFGFVTGEAQSLAALTGAVTADLTVVGDLRDLSQEGGRMVAGEPYNEIVLGLAVVGIGVTGTTLVSGGSTLVGRVGVTLAKVAAKTGALTVDFSRTLSDLVRRAVDMPRLKRTLAQIDLSDIRTIRAAMDQYAGTVRGAELFPVLGNLNDLRRTTSASEAVRLMRHVRTTEDLTEVGTMGRRLGVKTRPVIEVTGKRSLRAFRAGLGVLDLLLANLLALASWLGSLVMLTLGRMGRRLARP